MSKTLVCGSRSIKSIEPVREAIDKAPFNIDGIVHGGAEGVDQSTDAISSMRGLVTIVRRPDYDEHGKNAPLVRNKEMVNESDNLIAVWDGESTGTQHVMAHAQDNGFEEIDEKYWSGVTIKYFTQK